MLVQTMRVFAETVTYDSALSQRSISGKILNLMLCAWKPGFLKSAYICTLALLLSIFYVEHYKSNTEVKVY